MAAAYWLMAMSGYHRQARMAKPVNAAALKVAAPFGACGFESRSGHFHFNPFFLLLLVFREPKTAINVLGAQLQACYGVY
jgi:hypothetical protein